jgi:hypothetical protein
MEVRVRWRACSARSRRPVLEGMEARQNLSMTMFDFVPARRHHGEPAGGKFSWSSRASTSRRGSASDPISGRLSLSTAPLPRGRGLKYSFQ